MAQKILTFFKVFAISWWGQSQKLIETNFEPKGS